MSEVASVQELTTASGFGLIMETGCARSSHIPRLSPCAHANPIKFCVMKRCLNMTD